VFFLSAKTVSLLLHDDFSMYNGTESFSWRHVLDLLGQNNPDNNREAKQQVYIELLRG